MFKKQAGAKAIAREWGGRRTNFQFAALTSPLDETSYAALETAGVQIVGLASKEDGLFVYKLNLKGRADAASAILEKVPAFIEMQPEFVEDKVSANIYQSRGLKYVGRGGAFKATVKMRRKVSREGLEKALPGMDSLEIDPFDSTLVHVLAYRPELLKLADGDEVQEILDPVERLPLLAEVRNLTGVTTLQTGFVVPAWPPTASWLSGVRNTGDGIWVCINEGIDPNFHDFMERNSAGADNLRRSHPTETWFSNFHGTHVASIVAGNGWNSHLSTDYSGSTTLQWRGMAPKALISSSGERGDVNNHSFTADQEGYYTSASATNDTRLSNHTVTSADETVNNVGVFATANNGCIWNAGPGPQYGSQIGYYSLLQNNKNGIKVGAVVKSSIPIRADYSSMGPSRDGRTGPDVMAPGGDEAADFHMEFDRIRLLSNAGVVKYQWNFDGTTPEWGAPNFEAWQVANPSQSNGILSLDAMKRSYLFSGIMSPLPTSAANDKFEVTYRATKRFTFSSPNISARIFWKRPQDSYLKGYDPVTGSTELVPYVDRLIMPADGTWRTVEFTLNSNSLRFVRGGWVSGDVIERMRFDFSNVGAVAANAGTQDYIPEVGTSMASPVVTGITALMLQKYREDIMKVRCNTCTIHLNPMWNSTAKAILIHTAKDMVEDFGNSTGLPDPDFVANGFNQTAIYGKGPDFATGYGMVDAVRAVGYVNPNNFLEGTLSQNTKAYYSITVPAGKIGMRVTLAWDDPAAVGVNDASTAYNVKLVNDLDLSVISLNTGKVYKPWVLDHSSLNNRAIPSDGRDPIVPADIQNNPAFPGRDSLNPVEVVDVSVPPAGDYVIVVNGRLITVDQNPGVSGINQDFSLVYDFPATPVRGNYLPKGAGQQVLAASNSTGFLLKSDGSIFSWGVNNAMQLGRGTFPSSPTPAKTSTMPAATAVSSINCHSESLTRDGEIWGWGCNAGGRIGDGSQTDRNLPVKVCNVGGQTCTGNRYIAISAGGDFSVAVKTDGTLWTWGDNGFGQLGYSGAGRLYPGQVGTERNWSTVSAGGGHVMALKTDGSLWVWGLNSDNQLGLNNGGANVSVPTRITGNLWLQIAATWDRSFGILSNSSLWGWGYNVDGGVNPGAGSSLPLPVQIGTATDWKDVAAGGCHALGLKNDGTLYGWGCNDVGNLGRGNTSGPPGDIQPVCNVTGQPCSGGKYLAISAGVEASLALKTDGTLWSWGGNAGGSLGNGTTTLSAYPKKISLSPNTLTGAQASLSSGSTKNLTNEGPDDWSHWGNLSATSFDKKAGITSRIGGYAPIGSFTAARYTSGLTTHTWSDGVSPTFSASTKTGVSTSVTATGFQVSVNTLPTEQKLRVYVGVNNARGKLDASLSDGSVVSYVNNALTSAGVLDGYYDLTFSSVTSGAKLNVKWTKESGSGSVNLQSAVLK